MATMATYRAIDPVTIIAGTTGATAGAVAIPRGARAVLSTDGANTCYVAGAAVRGDFIAMQDIYVNRAGVGEAGSAVSLGAGGDIVVLAGNVTIAIGDPIYGGAAGTVTNVAGGGALYLGKAREAAAPNTLFGLHLETVA